MRKTAVSGLTLLCVGGLLLSGCSPMAVTGSTDADKSAFGARKHFAVVSIASTRTISGEKGITDLFKDDDAIKGANSQPIIDALEPKIIGALASDKHFALVPEHAVLASRAYRNIKEDERVIKVLFSSNKLNVAGHYKYISTPEKFSQLAKELNVDGVIGITMNFSVVSSTGGLSINGIGLGKKSYSSVASISAVAYDKNGKVIWKDATVKQAEPGDAKAVVLLDAADFAGTDFEKMHPSAIAMGRKAVDVLVARLDDTLAGKEVSSMQSMK